MAILKPIICGKKHMFFPSICDSSAYFVGTTDVTIKQGTDFDLRDGVRAYDEEGNSLPYTVYPTFVEPCRLGTQTFRYQAEGATETRYITVVEADSPTITGLTTIEVKTGEEFDPTSGVVAKDGNGNEATLTTKVYPTIRGLTPLASGVGTPVNTLTGVTATDGNGNLITVTCEEGSMYTPTETGVYTLHYSATDSQGLTATATRTLTVGAGQFVGVSNATINQGTSFDLRSGVTALDYSGNSVPFVVSPSTVVSCQVGTQTFTYTADGVATTTRTITVNAVSNPTITGLTNLEVNVNEEFDPLTGVVAKDGNNNTLTPTVQDITGGGDDPTPTPTTHRVRLFQVTDGVLGEEDGGDVYGAGIFAHGASVTVTASPNTGYNFTNWSSRSSGTPSLSTNVSYSFTITADIDLYAMFDAKVMRRVRLFQVTDGVLGDEDGGDVYGAGSFEDGTNVTVRASANSGYDFTNWSSGQSGTPILSTNASYTFTVTADTDLYAMFDTNTSITYYTVNAIASTGGTVSGSGTYAEGSTVTLTATPSSGYRFVNWRYASTNGQIISSSRTITFTVDDDHDGNYYALFEPITTYTINVHAGSGGTATGSGTYVEGDTVTLTAIPNSGYEVREWRYPSGNGQVISVSSTITFTADSSHSGNYYVTFDEIAPTTYTVRVHACTNGELGNEDGGEVSGDGTFTSGSSVTVRAYPESGYEFTNWSSRSSGTPVLSTSTSYTFTVTADTDLYAMFDEV